MQNHKHLNPSDNIHKVTENITNKYTDSILILFKLLTVINTGVDSDK